MESGMSSLTVTDAVELSGLQSFERDIGLLLGGEDQAPIEDTLRAAIVSLEANGCTNRILWGTSKRRPAPKVNVLLFDLVWLSPDPKGTLSEDGHQTCYCKTVGTAGSGRSVNWYKRTLHRFWADQNPRSLLSYREFYNRPTFLKVSPLVDEGSDNSSVRNSRRSERAPKRYTNEAWKSTFEPEPPDKDSSGGWEERFARFKLLVNEELQAEFPRLRLNDTLLAWIYVNPTKNPSSASAMLPPVWAASMFVLFIPPTGNRLQDVELLLGNLLNALQTAAHRTLQTGKIRRTLAQVLCHEFKNINQDVALLAQQTMSEWKRIPPSVRSVAPESFVAALRATELAAQATTAFTTAAYWFAAPSTSEMRFAREDAAFVFSNILYFTLRMVAPAYPEWRLDRIPSMDDTFEFLRARFFPNARTPSQLLSDVCVCLLVFFAMEPVRNMRSGRRAALPGTMTDIEVQVHDGKVRIVQRTLQHNAEARSLRSNSVIEIMRAFGEGTTELDRFIEVNPDIAVTCIEDKGAGAFRVERVTDITVHKIPYLHQEV